MVTGFELYRVTAQYVTADLIVWRRYRRRTRGIVELMLDANPQLAFVHRSTPFIPPGTYVRIPIDPDQMRGISTASTPEAIWTDWRGYTT